MSWLPQEAQRKRLQRLRSRRQQFSLEKVNVAGKDFHSGINKYSPSMRYSPRKKLQSMIMYESYLACPSARHSVSVPNCCHRDLESISQKYFLKIFSHFMTVWVPCFHPILNYRHCHWREAAAEKKLHFSETSPQAFQTVSVCCRVVWNWYLVEPPEMSLTAFYNLLLRNYLSHS